MHDNGAAEFAEWVGPLLPTLTWLAARLLPHDHEDLVQDTVARAWASRSTYDEAKGSRRAWASAILVNQAHRSHRRSRLHRTRWRLAASSVEPPPSVETDVTERLTLDRAIDRLTARQCLAVSCVYFVGLTVAETAVVMGCAEGTVKSTLSDARRSMRQFLEAHDAAR